MQQNLEAALTEIFGAEGGFQRDPRDPGNYTPAGVLVGTKYGISAKSYPQLDIAHLTVAQAAAIYRRDFAAPIGFASLPTGVDLSVLDCAVNSGPGRARALYSATRRDHALDTIPAFNDARRSFLRGLKAFRTYGTGWLKRVARIEAVSMAWALQDAGLDKQQTAQALRNRAGANADRAQRNTSSAGAAGTASGTGAVATQVSPELLFVLVAFAVFTAVAAVFLIHRARVRRAQAEAYATLAQALATE